MKTDTLFYQLFQSFHTLLFELIDRPIADAEGYQFTTAEIKEKAFRFDGIFIPTTDDKPIFFIEVQFQPKNDFYWEYLSEIFLYLNQYRPINKWQAVAIFAKRNCEPEIVDHVQEMIDSNRIIRVYLEDWVRQETNSLTIAIIQLILAPEDKAPKLARQINEKVQQEPNTDLQDQVVKFIETVLVYKFPKLSRQEIEAMFTFNDLKNTRVYQDAKQEGLQLGKQEGLQLGEQRGLQRQVAMLLRMLTRKFGKLSPRTKNRITKLSVTQLENLAEVIFDLQTVADLNTWLRNNG
ncbi:MAG: Rpn family recombination-promoting nuclease/putative transposase [Pseudanabaena sp. ELA645]